MPYERKTGNGSVTYDFTSTEEISFIGWKLAATSTAGSRYVGVEVIDENDDVVMKLTSRASVEASQTREGIFGQGVPNDSNTPNNLHSGNLPDNFEVRNGFHLKVFDIAAGGAVDANDSFTVQLGTK